MFAKLLATDDSRSLTLIRLALAIAIFPHGAQKLLGWWSGPGFTGTIGGFAQGFGIAAPLAVAAILVEFFAPLSLALGIGTRFAGLALAIQMAVAASFHRGNGFFMNWTGTQAGEGFEYHILAIAIGLALAIAGGGAFSLDRLLARPAARMEASAATPLRRAA